MPDTHTHAVISANNPWTRVIPLIEELAFDHGGPILVANDLTCIEEYSRRKGDRGKLPIGWDQGPTLWMHLAFENVPAAVSGAEAIWKNRRKLKEADDRIHKVCALCGPSVAYDKMFQSVSGMLERWHDIVFVCFDDHVRTEVGHLVTSAMPRGARAWGVPVGNNGSGRETPRKDMTYIALMHHIPFAAQTTLNRVDDVEAKLRKAFSVPGPTFIDVLCVSPAEWEADPDLACRVLDLAVATNYWPIYEAEFDRVRITSKSDEQVAVSAWLQEQPRFSHVLHPENAALLAEVQHDVDQRWKELLALEAAASF